MFEKYKLIVILKPHCPWCTMLKNLTLPLVHSAGIKAYEVIGQAVEEYYEVEAFPALIYTDLEGNMLHKEEGYVPMKRVVEVFSKLESGEKITEYEESGIDNDQPSGSTDNEDLSPISESNPPSVEQKTEILDQSEVKSSDLPPRKRPTPKNRKPNS